MPWKECSAMEERRLMRLTGDTHDLGTFCYLCVRAGQLWFWRREGDSNPRYGCPYTRFPSVRLQPLGHPSAGDREYRGRTLERKRIGWW